MSDIVKNIEGQIEQQGVALFKVKDGEVLVLTTSSLEKLLEISKTHPDGRVIVFIKSPGTA